MASTPGSGNSTQEFSSLFMTPCSATGKPVYNRPKVLTPLHMSWTIPSPGPSPARESSPVENKDIVLELYKGGLILVVEKILSYLFPADLISCRAVCTDWDQLISKNHTSTERIRKYRIDCEAENQLKTLTPNPLPKPPLRQVLSSISDNIQSRYDPLFPVTRSLPPLHPYIKLRPCPNCYSPAKLLNLRRAECTNSNCNFDFCNKCFESWHEGSCPAKCEKFLSEVKKPNSVHIVGTSKSKKRLKRL